MTRVLIIEALDHFRTVNIDTENCVLKYIGEYVEEDDDYITLRYKSSCFDGVQDEESLIKIIKSAIISKIFFEETGGMVRAKCQERKLK